jgi:hypothetical protein
MTKPVTKGDNAEDAANRRPRGPHIGTDVDTEAGGIHIKRDVNRKGSKTEPKRVARKPAPRAGLYLRPFCLLGGALPLATFDLAGVS